MILNAVASCEKLFLLDYVSKRFVILNILREIYNVEVWSFQKQRPKEITPFNFPATTLCAWEFIFAEKHVRREKGPRYVFLSFMKRKRNRSTHTHTHRQTDTHNTQNTHAHKYTHAHIHPHKHTHKMNNTNLEYVVENPSRNCFLHSFSYQSFREF